MQVVYSGGTSTPTPSPRFQRKTGYSRPVMPGYNTHVQPQVYVQRSREKLTEGDTTLRDSIPLMSKGVATFCLVLNIFLPGSGTLTSGLSVLCCSKVRPRGGSKKHCIWMNAGVALIQFLLTFLFLLGWIWSITWGIAFLTISRQHNRRQAGDDKHRHREGDKTHGKIYDTSKHSQPTSHHCSHDGKPCKHHQQHTNHHHQHHHPHHHSDQMDHLDFHQNNNKSHPPHHIRKSRTPSPRESPAIHRNENTWVTEDDPPPPAQIPAPVQINTSGDTLGEDSHATAVPYQPIIVLQKAPEAIHSGVTNDVRKSSPNDTIMQARTRHMKMLQRKMSDNDLSPFVLTNKQLEAIVIHDFPVVASSASISNGARNSPSIEEEGLPKMELT